MGSDTEFFHGCSRGRRKRRISTNRIHLCPSSTLLINPIWDVQSMRLGLGGALPGEERVRNVLSQSSWRRTKAGIWS